MLITKQKKNRKKKSLKNAKKDLSFFQYLSSYEKTSPKFMSKIREYHINYEANNPDKKSQYWKHETAFKNTGIEHFNILRQHQKKKFFKICRLKINHVEVLLVLLNDHYRAEAGKLSLRHIKERLPHRSKSSLHRSVKILEKLGFFMRITKYNISEKRYDCSIYTFIGFKTFFAHLNSPYQRGRRKKYGVRKDLLLKRKYTYRDGQKKPKKRKPDHITHPEYIFNESIFYRKHRASNE